jgi:hypothetical protein
MENKKSSVDFLIDELGVIFQEVKLKSEKWNHIFLAFLKAKEIQKEQMIWVVQEAYGHGRSDDEDNVKESVDAILKTFFLNENYEVDSRFKNILNETCGGNND